MKKKVAIVVCAWPPQGGGIGNNAYYQAQNLAGLDYEVEVFTPRYKSTKAAQENLKVNYLSMWPRLGMAGFLFSLLFKLGEFDIVHLYYPFFGTDLIIWFFKKFNPAKKLILHYEMDPIGRGWQRIFFKYYLKLFLGLMVSASDKIVVLSDDHAEHSYLAKFLKKWPAKFTAIPNGIDESIFKSQTRNEELRKKYNIDESDKVIIFVGGLDKQHYFKGVEVLLKSFSLLSPPCLKGVAKQRAEASGARVDECDPGSIQRCLGTTSEAKRGSKLLIVGDGGLKQNYQKMAKDLGIESDVIFVGWIDNKNLPEYYCASDVFVLPSTASTESFGIVTAEAQACGLPAIVSNWPGSRQTLEEGKTGLLIRPGDVNDLSEKLIELLSDNELRKEMGERAQIRACELYGWQKIIGQIDDLYRGL